MKASTTWAGSLTPLDSTTRHSKGLSPSAATTLLTSCTRSSRLVQHMHPFDSSISSSSLRTRPLSLISFSSKFTLPRSFTNTAHLRSSLFSNTCFNSVVFPLPRNPLSTVTGSLAPCGSGASSAMTAAASRRPLRFSRSPLCDRKS